MKAEEGSGGGTGSQAPDAPAGSGARSPLDTLLVLQDLDTSISQLQHRRAALPERQALAGVTAALGDAVRRAAGVQVSRAELVERQKALEEDVGVTTRRREMLEQRMYAARGAPARELQAMDEEVQHLRQRRDELEDTELEVMVALEPLDAELASLETESAELRERSERLQAALRESEVEIDGELETRVAERDDVAASLPEDLRSRYETLRARLGGTGAARLVGNRCSGCHLELPAMEVDRIRRVPAGTVVLCDQCGRILVPTSGGSSAA